jgi:hypothetical protein
MYKLTYTLGKISTIKSEDLSLLYKLAKLLYKEKRGSHYRLVLKNSEDKIIKDWSCPCYRGLGTKLPSFKY